MTIPLDQKRTNRHQPAFNGNGQYKIATPDGQIRGYTRTSTIGERLEDKYRLGQWQAAKVAQGMGRRPDLVELAAGHTVDGDRDVYRGIVKEATTTAEASSAANYGTALHRYVELYDRGTPLHDIPEPWHRHLLSYRATIEGSPFADKPLAVEQVLVLDDYRIAGRVDQIRAAAIDFEAELADGTVIEIEAGDLLIADIKTGRSLDYSGLKFGCQLAIYANHHATWHPDSEHELGGTRGPRINVNRELAVIFHLPAKDPTAPCEIHWVDLGRGYDAFLCALELGEHRAQSSKVISRPATAHVSFAAASAAWLRQRLHSIMDHQDAAHDLMRRWPNILRGADGSPRPLPHSPTPEQAEALGNILSLVEADHQLPFGTPEPQPKEPA